MIRIFNLKIWNILVSEMIRWIVWIAMFQVETFATAGPEKPSPGPLRVGANPNVGGGFQ